MKFRFYITNTFQGIIQGTDSETVAMELSTCEDYYVVDTETGECLLNEAREPIGEWE